MKTIPYPFKKLCVLTIMIFVAFTSQASFDGEARKTLTKEFSCDKMTRLEVSNRYGKIEVTTWDKPQIRITATVIVKAGSKAKADDRLAEISTDISKTGNNITAVTKIAESGTNWWSGWWGNNKNVSTEINYQINMPAYLEAILENKYGNIYLPDLSAKTSINLKYGNLYSGNLDNDLLIDLAYGKANVGNTKNLSGELSYSDYTGRDARVVLLTSKYSKVQLEKITSITTSSKYDTYKVGEAGNITMTGAYDDITVGMLQNAVFTVKYTNLDVGSVSQSLTADIDYGSLDVSNLKAGFSGMVITTNYAPVKIYGAVPCKVDISGKYFDADLGKDFIFKNKVSEGSIKRISGYKMSEKTSATIRIESRYGNVTLK